MNTATLKGTGAVLAAAAVAFGLAYLFAPTSEAGGVWTGSMVEQGWMAWTLATATFFIVIATLLALMSVLYFTSPERERVGILGIATTRGDRLFITLLGSAWINLAWMGFSDLTQWGALGVCALWAAIVFRFV